MRSRIAFVLVRVRASRSRLFAAARRLRMSAFAFATRSRLVRARPRSRMFALQERTARAYFTSGFALSRLPRGLPRMRSRKSDAVRAMRALAPVFARDRDNSLRVARRTPALRLGFL